MLTLAKAILTSGALIYGAANVNPTSDSLTNHIYKRNDSTPFAFIPDHSTPDTFLRDGSDIERNVEQASEHFDQFAMQIPGVLGKRIHSVMKHGTKAILIEDSESKAAEEEMVGSLVKGLRHIGDALAADMVRSAENSRG